MVKIVRRKSGIDWFVFVIVRVVRGFYGGRGWGSGGRSD